jgi:sporulation protein YlmC with PRC-barrel domain
MLRSINELKGFDIVTTDGEIGDVKQCYFDDERWTVRYLVVTTGDWASEEQVLISPFAVTQIDGDHRKLHVALTQEQIARSPGIDPQQPISRQMEATYSDYYGYPYYWHSRLLWGASASPNLAAPQSLPTRRLASTAAAAAIVRVVSPEVHLHSTQEVGNYRIAATDGLIGYVSDFIVDAESWTIRYLVIDPRNWLLGKKVVILPRWISAVDWAQGQVHVQLSREAMRQSPEYDSTNLLSHKYETQLHRYYGQPGAGPHSANEK